MEELITKEEQWAKDKGLDQADSSKQMLKTIEEIGEVAASLARKDEYGLRERLVENGENSNINKKIDWEKVNEKLERNKKKSLEYLKGLKNE